jgi:hypothetical protein
MKKIAIALLAFVFIFVTIFVLAILNKPPIQISTPSPVTKTLNQKSGYVIREHNGKVAVFYHDGRLFKAYDVLVSTLPEYDKTQLKQGVYAETFQKMRSLIEDYTS